ncbi:MAG: pyruvate kinase [Verrucomicrobia bacterium]|nr:pyruvate kinase [Verrucomicrobiota bacterium]MDA1087179.1 pyruvate kinase [Verrucomicrobiota bacterium]
MSRTKIVCTIGPASRSEDIIEGLIEAGMSVARLNFSHGDHEEHRENIRMIRAVSERMGRSVAILQDLSGPKIRVGTFADGPILLADGDIFTLTVRDVPGDARQVSVNYSDLPRALDAGDLLLLSDGALELEVIEVSGTDIVCRVTCGGTLGSNKGINLPNRTTTIPCLTDKDREDLSFGLDHGVDYVALSFVRQADDILQTREIISRHEHHAPVIAKIEKHEAIENIDEIIEVADGIMVARGDLGIEIPLERVPTAQKMIIEKANRAAKPVITATQMLGSMVKHPRPTRAEVTDVANAVLTGSDAIMLSEETAVGNHPVLTVQTMKRICTEAEAHFPYSDRRRRYQPDAMTVLEAISYSATGLASNLNAGAIVCFSHKGRTAKAIVRYRPEARVLAVTNLEQSYRQFSLLWGVSPVLIGTMEDTEETVKNATQIVRDSGFVKAGGAFVITGGLPMGQTVTTNSLITVTLD